MIQNYITIAWRNLLKNKAFSVINITGLAIGLSCFILIALYVADELSYDKHFKNGADIYRVNSDILFSGNESRLAVCSDPMGETLKKDYPQVLEYTRIYASSGSKLVKKGTDYITENNVCHADSTFFKLFSLPLLSGDPVTSLSEPNTVVISASTAKKYFNTTDAIGKYIEADKTPYKVTAVMKDIPLNTHFQFDMIFSMKNVNYQMGNFLSHNFHTYVQLKSGVDPVEFEKNFVQVIDKYILPQAGQFMNIKSMDEFKRAGNNLSYSLIPLIDIHLKSDRFPELSTNGSIQFVYIFSAVALFILLIACINFMNLSTARSANRSKEVGIRKVLGSNRSSLIKQFLSESVIMVIISLVIAIILTVLILPYFNTVAAKQLSSSSIGKGYVLAILLALPIVVGVLAGIYPAFFLSRFQPLAVLKGNQNSRFKKSWLRNGLVVFQFSISIILIIGTLVIYQQLNYIQTKKLGFTKEQVLLVSGIGGLNENAGAFKNEILQLPGVSSATITSFLPVSFSSRSDNTFSTEAVMTPKNSLNMQTWDIDYDYINTLGMQMAKGRNFNRDFGTDSSAMLINEATAAILGFKDPIGKKIYTRNNLNSGDLTPTAYTIVGVVKNFHFESLREQIGPVCMRLGRGGWIGCFKVNTQDIPGLIKQVEHKWKTMAPSLAFSYRFLDESFDNMYRSEQRMGSIAFSFSLLAILIACLGLFGLATYMAEQRIKEIGIRKVLGATVTNITTMLSKDFLILVLIATLIAFPLSWWAMNNWLQGFAYRIDIEWWVFIVSGILAIAIALITVSVQAIKASLTNPVKSLRTE